MRILYHFRTRGVGAEGVHIAGIAGAFRELGHQVTFSSPTGVDPTSHAGADPFANQGDISTWLARKAPRVAFELMELGYNALALARNARILHRQKVDLIYERHAYFGYSTGLLARWADIPLVLEVNELVGDERVRAEPTLSAVALATDRIAFSLCDLIVVVSPHLKRRLIERRVDPNKIIIQPNGVARSELEKIFNGVLIRERYQLSQDSLLIGFVGFFVKWHRLDHLVEAFAGLCRRWPNRDLRLMLVGEGPLKEELKEQARSLGVLDRLLLTGAVPHHEAYQHIAAFDVAVIPFSNPYRSPIKLFEYMSQGRAVVAPATEPIELIIRDGGNGLLFPPDNTSALEAALARAADDHDLRRKCGLAAREQVFSRHTWTRNAEEILQRIARQRSESEPAASPPQASPPRASPPRRRTKVAV